MTPDDIEKAMQRARAAIQWAICVQSAQLQFSEPGDALRASLHTARSVFGLSCSSLGRFVKLTAASVFDLSMEAAAWPDGSWHAEKRQLVLNFVRALRI